MKRKIFSILLTLVLLASFSLVTAVPAGAADPTTIASSTMVFEGTLTDNGDGTYTGVIPMVVDGGYDLYARNGATAWFGDDPSTGPEWTPVVISNHDGWPTFDPDTPDWYQYSLELTSDGWAVRNHPGATAEDPWYNTKPEGWPKAPMGVPMSGTMDWLAAYAAETDTGAYLPATGTAEVPGGAATKGGGAACWDMDWSWGSEAVPLAFPGFAVAIVDLGGGNYQVTMTPAAGDSPPGPVVNEGTSESYGTIQAAIDAADPDDTINVAAGIYNEQVVIGDSLTLQGAGDTTIIQPSGAGILTTVKTTPWVIYLGAPTEKEMAAIVFVDTAGETVNIKDLKIDGSLITEVPTGVASGEWVAGLAYLETSGTVDVTVIGNPNLGCRTCGIWASAITETTQVEVTKCNVIGYNRAGIYALGGTMTADYHHNTITGPGGHATQVPNGMFFLRGATGSATYNTITALEYLGETYRSSGIATYNAGTDVTFGYNIISNVDNAFALSIGTSGTIVEYNDIFNNHTGVRIEAGATNSIIQYNDIHDNDFAIRCGAEMGAGNMAHYNNFVDNPGLAWINVEGGTTYTYEGAVCNLSEKYDLDAALNWWGDVAGPETSPKTTGLHNPYEFFTHGDSVSDYVDYLPWLIQIELVEGWNIVSMPIAVANTLHQELDPALVEPAYYFDSSTQDWWNIPEDASPMDAWYIKMKTPVTVNIWASSEATFPWQKEMKVGWNFVGLAELYRMRAPTALASALHGTGEAELWGYSQVMSPSLNGQPWTYMRGQDQGLPPGVILDTWPMFPTKGYWVFMVNDGVLGGFTSTPIVEVEEILQPPPPPGPPH